MDNAEIMDRIYLELHNTIAPKVGDQPLSDLLCLFTVGRSVLDGFDITSLANTVPQINKSYASSGKLVSGGYFTALSGHFKNDQKHTPQEEERHQKALRILYNNYNTEDEEESNKYKKYKRARKKWLLAVDALEAAKNNPNYPKKGSDDFPTIKELELDAKETYDDLKMAYRDEVENALREINSYYSFSQTSYIERLKDKYLLAEDKNFSVTCEPQNWTNQAAWKQMAWKKVNIKASASSSKVHTDIQKVDNYFQDNYKSGFWFFSSGGSSERMDYSLSKDLAAVSSTDKLAISLELAEVAINRNWLDSSLFTLQDVYIDGQKRGCITKGSLTADGANQCAMPLLPVSLILSRNVNVYDDFNENVYKFIERAKADSSCQSHFGPFGSGSENVKHFSSSDYTDEEKKAYPHTSKIEFPGVQLIGIKCAVTSPLFPPKDGC